VTKQWQGLKPEKEMTLQHWIGDHPDHYPLPPTLERDLGDHRRNHLRLQAIESRLWEVLLPLMLKEAADSVKPFGPPAYHNGGHFATVVDNIEALTRAGGGHSIHNKEWAVAQGLMIAAAGHDFAHQGSTLRSDAPGKIALPNLGLGIRTEEVSAILVDQTLKRFNVDVGMRLFVCRHIWATTFGNPKVKPVTKTEYMLALADVAPVLPPLQLLTQGIRVVYEEVPPGGKRPKTWSSWIESRKGFSRYVRGLLERVPEARTLRWSMNLNNFERMLSKGSDELRDASAQLFPEGMIDLSR